MPPRRNRRSWGKVRASGRTRFQASYPDPLLGSDIMHKAPKTFGTRMDAEGWLAAERKLIDSGTWTPPATRKPAGNTITLREYANEWIGTRDLTPKTRALYDDLLDSRIFPTFGDSYLSDITAAEVRAWIATMRNIPGRRKQCYDLLRTITRTAASDGLIPASPCQEGNLKPAKSRTMELLTPAELWALYDKMPQQYRLSVLVMTFGALRFGECIELRRKDVQDRDGVMVLRIRRACVRVGKEMIVGKPKTQDGVRDVTLPGSVADLMREHLRDRTCNGAEALVFTTNKGTRLSQATYATTLRLALSKIGHPGVRIHDLRHLGGTLAAQAGATTRELMQRLGHSTPAQAMQYQHVAAGRDAAIADRLGEIAGR